MTTKKHWFNYRWLLAGATLAGLLTFLGTRFGRVSAAAPAAAESAAGDEAVACFGHVDVNHGVTSLYPTQPGRVAAVLVEEEQAVKAGDVLVRLEDTVPALRVAEARADLAAARAQLAELRKLPQQHAAQVAQLQAALKVRRSRRASAQTMYEWKKDLLKRDLAKRKDIDIAYDQVREAEALVLAAAKKLTELQLRDPLADVRRAEQEVKAKESRLGQALDALKECGLRAPTDGKVLRVLVGPGDLLTPGARQPVVLFCPAVQRFIRAEVAQESAYRVKVGQPVVIRDDSSDRTVWRGRVKSMSDWYTHRRSILQEPLQVNDVRTLECIVTLDPGQPPLRIGQRVRVLIGKSASPWKGCVALWKSLSGTVRAEFLEARAPRARVLIGQKASPWKGCVALWKSLSGAVRTEFFEAAAPPRRRAV